MAAMRESTELLAFHVSLVGNRVAGGDHHVKLARFVPLGLQLDAVRTGIYIQLLESSVETVDDADVITIDVDLRIRRLDFQAKRSRALIALDVTASARRTAASAGVTGIG